MLDDRREAFYDTHFESCRLHYEPFDELASRLVVELILTCDIASQLFARQLSEFGLSKSTYNILMLLRHAPPEGMQLHDLGELLLVSRANITGLIHHLEQKGYVTREVPASDRRVRYARITAEAVKLLDCVTPAHLSEIAESLGEVSKAEQEELRRLLQRVRSSLLIRAQQKSKNRRATLSGNCGKTNANGLEQLATVEKR